MRLLGRSILWIVRIILYGSLVGGIAALVVGGLIWGGIVCERLDEGGLSCMSPVWLDLADYVGLYVALSMLTSMPASLAILGLFLLFADISRLAARKR
ncbi:MAG: hypothetical protein AAFX39_07735 [Pseudomonadota bacterium]